MLTSEITPPVQLSAHGHCLRISCGAGRIATVIGLAVLVGWATGCLPLTRVLPGLVAMKPNTAIGLCFCGLSLLLFLGPATAETRRAKRYSAAFAGAAAILGLLVLGEYASGWNIGIDELLFRDPFPSRTPGRMAPISAVNFLCLGLALGCLHFPKLTAWAHGFTACVAFTSVLAIIGYCFGVASLYQPGNFTAVALHTAIAFLVLCIGLCCATSGFGFMRLLTASEMSGVMVRRYGLVAILWPFLISKVCWRSWIGRSERSAAFILKQGRASIFINGLRNLRELRSLDEFLQPRS